MGERKRAQKLRVDEVLVQKLRENRETIQKLTWKLQGDARSGSRDCQYAVDYPEQFGYLITADHKGLSERRFGVPFNRPAIPYLCKGHILITSIWSKSFARNILRSCVLCGRNLERRHDCRRHWRIRGDRRIRTPHQKAQCKGSVNADKTVTMFDLTSRRWNSQSLWRINVWEHLPWSGIVQNEERNKKSVSQGESDEHSSPIPLQDDSTRDDAETKNDFWSIMGDFIHRHHVEPGVKLYVPKEESFRFPLKYIWRHGSEGDWWGNKQLQDPTVYGQKCGSICRMHRSEK